MSNLDFGTSQNLKVMELDLLISLSMAMTALYFIHLVEVDQIRTNKA